MGFEPGGAAVRSTPTASPRWISIDQIAGVWPFAINRLMASRTVVFPQLFVPTIRLIRPRSFIVNRWNPRKSWMVKFLILMARTPFYSRFLLPHNLIAGAG